ncbi:retrovirus-related pol polyprotein from transposon TNT 1-94 [Tanacetum coccineum]
MSMINRTEDIDDSMVPEKVSEEVVVQQPEPELKNRTPKNFGSEFQLYLIEGTSDEVSGQHSYCFKVKDEPKTYDEAWKSYDDRTDIDLDNNLSFVLVYERIMERTYEVRPLLTDHFKKGKPKFPPLRCNLLEELRVQFQQGPQYMLETSTSLINHNLDAKDIGKMKMILEAYAYFHNMRTANENRNMMERFLQPTNDPLALVLNASIQHLSNSLALLTQSYKSHLPQTNNQLRTSSNARNKATVQDGRVVVQDVRGRYNANNQGKPFQRNNARGNVVAQECRGQNRGGIINPGRYNCNGLGHIARECPRPKRLQDSYTIKSKAQSALIMSMYQVQTTNHNTPLIIHDSEDNSVEKAEITRKIMRENMDNNRKKAETLAPKPIYTALTCIYPIHHQACPQNSSNKKLSENTLIVTHITFTEFDKKRMLKLEWPRVRATGVNTSTEASGSKPRSNTKKNRILPAKTENKKKVGLNKTVRFICTDNGTEFVNQRMSEYYEGVGIFHQKSVPRTPQQNGVVERRNRTLVEAARTMMIFSKAPMFL